MIARGCSHVGTYLQMVGRVLRLHPSKSRATVIDLRGVVHQHGLPGDDRAYSLTGKAIAKLDALPPLRQCAKCGAVARPTSSCARCGWVFPALPPPRVKRAPMTVVNAVSADEKRRYFDALVKKQQECGYKAAWVGIMFKARFGYWPPFGVGRTGT